MLLFEETSFRPWHYRRREGGSRRVREVEFIEKQKVYIFCQVLV
jgi:hypothetical protein